MSSQILNKELFEKIKKDRDVIAVLIFGSFIRSAGRYYKDIDVCIVLDKKYDSYYMSKKRLRYLTIAKSKIDIQIFQQLPLYIRIEILREGKIIFCRNISLLYDIAYSTIKEFEDFKIRYQDYLSKTAIK